MRNPLLGALSLSLLATPALALDFSWTNLYSSSTALPGTNQTPFFLSEPAISGHNVAFSARYTDQWGDYEGVYALIDGSLSRILDTSMTLPDSNGALMDYTLYAPAIHGSEVALYAVGYRHDLPDGAYPWNAGIYRWTSGTLSRVADEQMNVPGSAVPFYDFNRPDIRNGTVIFNGVSEDADAAGVYTQSAPGQPLHTVADLSTPVPGNHPAGTTFFGFPYRLDHTTLFPDGSSLFLGGYQAPAPNEFSGRFGIYRTAGPTGPLSPIAEDGVTPIPNSSSVFTDIYTATVADDDSTVVFFGRDLAGTRGIYAARNGSIQTLVDSHTPVPGESKNFGSFGQSLDEVHFAYNNGVLLFEGYDRITDLNNVLHGLYLATLDGQIVKLLSPGQTFDSKTIDYWLLGRDSLHDNGIGLSVHFTDGSSGIYTTSTADLALPSHVTGDTNDDRVVDLVDLNNVLNHFGASGPGTLGDINRDNVVDLQDLNDVLNNFGAHYAAAASLSIPEPSLALSSILYPLSALLLTRRRHP